ncbi:hypothetical protein ACJ41O_011758 [Fusarium nematophilum]
MKNSFIIAASLFILGAQAQPAWPYSFPMHWKHPLRTSSPAIEISKRTPKDEAKAGGDVDDTAFWLSFFPELKPTFENTASDNKTDANQKTGSDDDKTDGNQMAADADQKKTTPANRLSKRQGFGSTKFIEGWEIMDEVIRQLAYQYGVSADGMTRLTSWEESVWEHDRHPFESNLWGLTKADYEFMNRWKPTSYFPDSPGGFKKCKNPLADC